MISTIIFITTLKKRIVTISLFFRISAIILLFTAILGYNVIYKLISLAGIGIYSGLFIITTISQILESFLLIYNYSYQIISILPFPIVLISKFHIFFLSLCFHYFIFNFISLGLLGIRTQNNFNYLLERKNLSSLFYLIIIIVLFFIFNFYLYKYVIYLDDTSTIKLKIDNEDVVLTGKIVNDIFANIGFTTSFIAGARISGNLLQHYRLGFIPQLGICVLSGTGVAIQYKILHDEMFKKASNETIASVAPTTISAEFIIPANKETTKQLIEGAVNIITSTQNNLNVYDKFKNMSMSNNKLENSNLWEHTIKNPLEKSFFITTDWKYNISVRKELGKDHIDWKQASPMLDPNYKLDTSSFIKSPIEIGEFNYKIFINLITNCLQLEFIKIYLLFMLLIIIYIKFIIKPDNIEFKLLNKFKLGIFINKLLIRYVNMWKKSNNSWLIFIVIMLLSFALTTFIALNRMKTFFL